MNVFKYLRVCNYCFIYACHSTTSCQCWLKEITYLRATNIMLVLFWTRPIEFCSMNLGCELLVVMATSDAMGMLRGRWREDSEHRRAVCGSACWWRQLGTRTAGARETRTTTTAARLARLPRLRTALHQDTLVYRRPPTWRHTRQIEISTSITASSL